MVVMVVFGCSLLVGVVGVVEGSTRVWDGHYQSGRGVFGDCDYGRYSSFTGIVFACGKVVLYGIYNGGGLGSEDLGLIPASMLGG